MFYAKNKDTNEIRYICSQEAGVSASIPSQKDWEVLETTENIKIGYDGKYYLESQLPEKPETLLAEEIRIKRNRFLFESDWTDLPNAPLSDQEKEEWRLYRQALRDITDQIDFPYLINWPQKA